MREHHPVTAATSARWTLSTPYGALKLALAAGVDQHPGGGGRAACCWRATGARGRPRLVVVAAAE
jgi:hypothetical protein